MATIWDSPESVKVTDSQLRDLGPIGDLLSTWLTADNSGGASRLEAVAGLFGKNRLRELAQLVKTEDVKSSIELVQTWLDDYRHGSLKEDLETGREQEYNHDFFIEILGYKGKPNVPFTFTPKDKTTVKGGQKADAVLRYTNPALGIDNIAAVVELKGADVDLDKPQQREGNLTPAQQAFKYKPLYPSCPFVVLSNFYEFRLYNNNQLDFERWTLDDLVDPEDDYVKFKTWFVLMRAENMVSATGVSATEALLSRVRQRQEEIGKEFYTEYKNARIELLQDIWRNNPATRHQFDIAIRKVQTIIDRVVFSCFAEDIGLLPDNIIGLVLDEAERSLYGESLFDHFKRFFRAVDKGSSQLGIPTGYNGGLFAEDPWIESLKISDGTMRRLANLSRFDFKEDLRVNILGHIFEQSITNLEEIRRKIREQNDPNGLHAEPPDPAGLRRKEGIYYTPDYIVQYIVDNTLGAWLREQETKCQAKHELTGRLGQKGYEKRQEQAYLDYLVILQGVKVLDLACGSGAFLVYVFDYLLKENQRVNYILGNIFASNDDDVRKILSDNIFGVDVNEESVEITKLSLWLKTAEKGKALTALDQNIKCGNSLVSDPTSTENPFSWPAAFPKVMEKGGFNVVVGNPPYVSAIEMTKNLAERERRHMRAAYETAVGAVDLYIYFFERGVELLKPGGKLGFISPNRWLSIGYGAALRTWLIGNVRIESILNASDTRVFEDAATYPVVTIMTKGKTKTDYKIAAGHLEERTAVPAVVRHDSAKLTVLPENIMGFLLNDKLPLTEKVFGQSGSLVKAGEINATSTAGEADDYGAHVSETPGIKIINTGTIDQFASMWGLRPFKKQGRMFLKPYLDLNEVSDSRRKLYESPKIIVAKIALRTEALYDRNGEYASIDTNCIHTFNDQFLPEYVLAWLNSRLYNYVFTCLFDGARMEGGYLGFSSPNLRCTPIKEIDLADQHQFVGPADRLAELYRHRAEAGNLFTTLIKTTFDLTTWPKANLTWWTLEATDFIRNFRKRFTTDQVEDLMAAHGRHSKIVGDMVVEIIKVNHQIDRSFYKLFDLSRREIDLVEAMPFSYL